MVAAAQVLTTNLTVDTADTVSSISMVLDPALPYGQLLSGGGYPRTTIKTSEKKAIDEGGRYGKYSKFGITISYSPGVVIKEVGTNIGDLYRLGAKYTVMPNKAVYSNIYVYREPFPVEAHKGDTKLRYTLSGGPVHLLHAVDWVGNDMGVLSLLPDGSVELELSSSVRAQVDSTAGYSVAFGLAMLSYEVKAEQYILEMPRTLGNLPITASLYVIAQGAE